MTVGFGIRRNVRVATIAVATVAALAAWIGHATQRALLIGVGDYIGARSDLDGPPHDVAAMRDVLTTHLGFAPRNIVELVDNAATRQGILGALDALVRDAKRGDFAFVYLSGHGTGPYNAQTAALSLSRDTAAFVPADYPFAGAPDALRDALLIGKRDIRPRLEEIDRRGVSGMVVVDSCFAENSTRSIYGQGMAYRFVDSGLDQFGAFPDGSDSQRDPYPYRHLVTMAASSEREKAIDWGRSPPSVHLTHDARPHGAFTDSLLRVLKNLGGADANDDKVVTNRELFTAVASRMRQADLPHSPQFQPSLAERDVGDSPAFRQAELVTAAPPAQRPLSIRVVDKLPLVQAAVADTAALVAAEGADHDIRVERAAGKVRLVTRHGDQVMLADSEHAAADALRQQPWIRYLTGRTNTKQRFDVEVSWPGDQGETYVEGDVLDLAIRADREAHLLVASLAADGKFEVLFPNRRGAFTITRSGTDVGFQTRVVEPFGIDHVVAAAFLQRPSFYEDRLLERGILPGSALHEELRQALTTDDANQARAVFRVVTVPRTAVGGPAR